MSIYRINATLAFDLFVCIAMASCNLPSGAAQNVRKPAEARHIDAQSRRLTIVRTGYSFAPPDSARIEVPYALVADTDEQVQGKLKALGKTLEGVMAPLEPTGNSVSVGNLQAGQSYTGGKQIHSLTGNMVITVRKISALKSVVEIVGKSSPNPLMLHLDITKPEVFQQSVRNAKLNAISEARKDADVLASAAGTKIIGVWELNDGETRRAEQTTVLADRSGTFVIPALIPVHSAQVTIVYEIAPGMKR